MDVSKGLVGPGKEWEWTGKESAEEIVRRWKEVPRLLREEQRVLEGYGLGWRNWRIQKEEVIVNKGGCWSCCGVAL